MNDFVVAEPDLDSIEVKEQSVQVQDVVHLVKTIIVRYWDWVIDYGLFVNDYKHEAMELGVDDDYSAGVFDGFLHCEVYILAAQVRIANLPYIFIKVEIEAWNLHDAN